MAWLIDVPFFSPTKTAAAILLLAVSLFMLLLPWLLLRAGKIRPASWWFLISATLIIAAYVFLAGGVRPGAAGFQLATSVIAAVLLGRSAAILSCGISLIADLGIGLFHQAGGQLPVLFPGNNLSVWAAMALCFVLALPAVYHSIFLLKESEDRFSKAFYSNPEGVAIVTKLEGRFLEVNDAFLEIIESARTTLPGQSIRDLDLRQDAKERLDCLEPASEHGQGFSTTLRNKSGRLRRVQLSSQPVELHGAECVLITIRDVTQQQALEQKLRQAAKLEALGRLAGGVAHDFNNLLTIIGGASYLLYDEKRRKGPNATEMLDAMLAATQRASELTRQLLAFTRHAVLQPAILDLNMVIDNFWKLLSRLIGEHIEVSFRLQSNLPAISADRGQIEQVIMNLALNARDAMPGGGKLAITTAEILVDEAFVEYHRGQISVGRYVMLTVADNGTGMDADVQAQIFEPFFTTKQPGQGTGLGMSTVQDIVRQNSGFILVESQQGKGSVFRVYLPAATMSEAAKDEPLQAEPVRGSETILLAEDDAGVGKILREFLESNGYIVLAAKSGQEALRICRSHQGKIDVLITDIVMPELGGGELVRTALQMRGNLPVVYLSGYAKDLNAMAPDAVFFRKPLDLEELARELRRILGHRKTTPVELS